MFPQERFSWQLLLLNLSNTALKRACQLAPTSGSDDSISLDKNPRFNGWHSTSMGTSSNEGCTVLSNYPSKYLLFIHLLVFTTEIPQYPLGAKAWIKVSIHLNKPNATRNRPEAWLKFFLSHYPSFRCGEQQLLLNLLLKLRTPSSLGCRFCELPGLSHLSPSYLWLGCRPPTAVSQVYTLL